MRSLLIGTAVFLAISADLSGQKDFITLDKKTCDYFLKGDYRNLKKTADTMISQGIDYYYLRMRLGLLAYNKQLYSRASGHFIRALKFNSLDTISREYIYNSYLFSGRKADANLYLESIPTDKRNFTLKSPGKPGLSEIYLGFSTAGYEVTPYELHDLNYNYEEVENSLCINAGFESFLSGRIKLNLSLATVRKAGTEYFRRFPTGTDLNFTQTQLYARLTGYGFPGWEFSGFGHIAFYKEIASDYLAKTEYLIGAGISKNGWEIRTGANFSLSNFSFSNQVRGEVYFTWLPSGNLNFYMTSGWMGQADINWGGTYQVNQEIGIKVFKFLWLESGIVRGNSFLYARNMGYVINNSFIIPATTIYGNIIVLTGKKFSITVTPYYSENQNYSWDLHVYRRTDKLTLNSFGGAIKLTYKIK